MSTKKISTPAPKTAEAASTQASTRARRTAGDAKWGRGVMDHGFVMVPSILIRGQQRLGLSTTQLVILLQLIDWWMVADKAPWSSKADLAHRIGISERQLQRQIAELERGGFVTRVEKITRQGKRPNSYDLSGLVQKLHKLAPEFEEARQARRQVERRGGLRAAPSR